MILNNYFRLDKLYFSLIDLSVPTIVFLDNKTSPVIEGERTSLKCNVESYYYGFNLGYKWLKTSGETVGTKQTLVFHSTARNMSGSYKCSVTGEFKGRSITKEVSQGLEVYCEFWT